ncbi:unnamed protein product [Durusdinium trenchii]|uniref:Pentatricopeptide repeat-containing protein, chloroplastic n=1 Tax=Durusdinium trenchii TaxID=1381693 RepID=A0ABP0M208_9DINO
MEHGRKEVQGDVMSACTVQITSYGRSNRWQEACRFFQEMPSKSLEPNTISFNAMLSACRNRWQTAVGAVFQEMSSERGHQLDVISFSSAISSEMGHTWQSTLEVLVTMRFASVLPNVFSCSAAMSSLEKGNQWQLSLTMLDSMGLQTIQANTVTFNAAISSCEQGHWRETLVLLEKMHLRSIEKDVVSFSAAISSCEKAGQWQCALSLLEAMPRIRIHPNIISFSATMSACAGANQLEAALRLFQILAVKKLQPNVITFGAVINACEKAGQWQLALSFLSAMSQTRVRRNEFIYNSAISSCEKGGHWQMALGLFTMITEKSLQPDVISYNAVISTCELTGHWCLALRLLQTAGLVTTVTAGAALSATVRRGEWSLAGQLLDALVFEHRVDISRVCWNVALSSCEKGHGWHHALQILDTLDQDSTGPDLISYNAAIASCESVMRAWPHVLGLFHQMSISEVQPDVLTHSSVITSFVERASESRRGSRPPLQSVRRSLEAMETKATQQLLKASRGPPACSPSLTWKC